MLSNCPVITYYHKTLNQNKIEVWETYYFYNVWKYGINRVAVSEGYTNNNKVEVIIPIQQVEDKSLFTNGDIICIGENDDIQVQSDLKGKEYYNITSISINDYGNNPHIFLGGM